MDRGLIKALKRRRQIRYGAPTQCGEVEQLIPRHLLDAAIAELELPWWLRWLPRKTRDQSLSALLSSTKEQSNE